MPALALSVRKPLEGYAVLVYVCWRDAEGFRRRGISEEPAGSGGFFSGRLAVKCFLTHPFEALLHSKMMASFREAAPASFNPLLAQSRRKCFETLLTVVIFLYNLGKR